MSPPKHDHHHPHHHHDDHGHHHHHGVRRSSALQVIGQPNDGGEAERVSRRGFVQFVGSGLALTSMAACQRPRQKIVPYVRRPVEVTPGNPQQFATAIAHEGYAFGVLVESHQGRPTKIEGNPEHPDSLGSSTARDQAFLVSLYDNDRAKQLTHEGKPATWKALLGHLKSQSEGLSRNGGAGLRFLVEPSSSPLLADLRARVLAKFPNARFVSFAGLDSEGAAAGTQLALGRPADTRHDLSKAKVILTLDADILDEGPETVRLNRQFSAGREPGAEMSRLYVVEPFMTVTGMTADHRLRVRGSDVVAVTQALVRELGTLLGRDLLGPLGSLAMVEPGATVDEKWVKAVAKDLAGKRGASAIIAGRRQPQLVHALVCAMNYALGNVGASVTWMPPVLGAPSETSQSGLGGLQALVQECAAGKVDTLVITARNPVFTAPADFKLDRLLPRVPHTIYLAAYDDETARVVKTVVPSAHPLESWGDLRASDGTVSIVQPLIEPLWSPVGEVDLLAAFVGDGDRGAHELLKAFWSGKAAADGLLVTGADFEASWEHWLAKGFIAKTAWSPLTDAKVDGAALATALGAALNAARAPGEGLELAFAVDGKVGDGRFGNNPWLQELPHPVTKITWDNAVMVSQSTAARLDGLRTGDIVQISLGDRRVRGPVYVQPGQADESITIFLGYGRRSIADGDSGGETIAAGVGFNVGVLRDSVAPWFTRGATVARVGTGYKFGITQSHWSDEERAPSMAGTVKEFLDSGSKFNKKLAHERGVTPWQIHEPHDYSKEQYKWAMSIDLNKCTGCGACVIACQSENNIAVVGRENVRIGREMHWIRVDRYYEDAANYGEKGPFEGEHNLDNTRTVVQPLMCLHCETAPCEYVCPVNATVHSDEGLNEMVYNRCVGTRYCSNNCPYKARHFNFLDYHGDPPEVETMVRNPDVTVRSRGIMEKCTYCVQRIERARIDSRIEGRAIADGEIVTACQQTCPAQAIEFGSLADANARVTAKHGDARRYDLLHELNTRPRTAYLARVRNPNPELG